MSRSTNLFTGRTTTSTGGTIVGGAFTIPMPNFSGQIPPTPPRTNSTDSTGPTTPERITQPLQQQQQQQQQSHTPRRSLHMVRAHARPRSGAAASTRQGRQSTTTGQQQQSQSGTTNSSSTAAHRAAMIHAMMQQAARQAAATQQSTHRQQQSNNVQIPLPRPIHHPSGTPTRRFITEPTHSATTPPSDSRPRGPVTGSGTVNPSVHPQFRSKSVCKLFCGHCNNIMCRRGMKAILLGNTKVELYSTDTPPTGVQLVYGDYLTQNCLCRIRDAACLGCGNVVGYHVTQPCEKCLEACNNGHFWMFLSDGVQPVERFDASGTKLLRWAALPCAEQDKDEEELVDRYDQMCR